MYSISNSNHISCFLRIHNSCIQSIYHTYLSFFLCHLCFPFPSFILFRLFFLVSTLNLCYKKEIDSKFPYIFYIYHMLWNVAFFPFVVSFFLFLFSTDFSFLRCFFRPYTTFSFRICLTLSFFIFILFFLFILFTSCSTRFVG